MASIQEITLEPVFPEIVMREVSLLYLRLMEMILSISSIL